jgi:hypothetical protein
MQRTTKLAALATLLLAGSASFAAVAQDTGTTPPAQSAGAKGHGPMHGKDGKDHGRFDQHRHGGFGGRGRRQDGVIGDLHALERLYMIEGKPRELAALYNDVLAKSKNPRTRDYAYHALARVQAAPTNVDQAIATMRKSLDENLTHEQERQAMFEQWKAKRAQGGANGAQ